MNEMYDYMKKKIEEMHNSDCGTITIGFAEFAKLYQMVCYMKQIQFIANGWE